MLSLRFTVWRTRRRDMRKQVGLRKESGGMDFDLNVLPPVLPKRPPDGETYSVTTKVWRKIVYWGRLHDRSKYGTVDRFSAPFPGCASGEKVAVLGGGAFGTALGAHIARKGHPVTIVLRETLTRDFINKKHVNPKYLSEFVLPTNLCATLDAKEAFRDCCALIHAVPVQASRKALAAVRHHVPHGIPVVAVSKGLELGSHMMMEKLISEALERDSSDNPVVVVSGPSFAKEIMCKRPTSVVAASVNAAAAEAVQRLLTSPYFRVGITDDVIGVEIAGALKNVLAIAAGICEGLGLGTNAMSALICQGAAEIRWLATAMGARSETLAGLSGMGDILLTCFGSLSRNRSVGVRLGRGEPLDAILRDGSGVAEGVYTAKLVVEIADRHRVLLPVLTSVARILNNEVSARKAVFDVMSLPPLPESA